MDHSDFTEPCELCGQRKGHALRCPARVDKDIATKLKKEIGRRFRNHDNEDTHRGRK